MAFDVPVVVALDAVRLVDGASERAVDDDDDGVVVVVVGG